MTIKICYACNYKTYHAHDKLQTDAFCLFHSVYLAPLIYKLSIAC